MTSGDSDRGRAWEDRIKSGALFALGLAALVNELFFQRGGPRLTALAFIGPLVGLQFVLPGRHK